MVSAGSSLLDIVGIAALRERPLASAWKEDPGKKIANLIVIVGIVRGAGIVATLCCKVNFSLGAMDLQGLVSGGLNVSRLAQGGVAWSWSSPTCWKSRLSDSP